MINRSRGLILVLLLGALASSGCARNADYMVPERLAKGLVVSLDGVGGYNWGPRWLREGLDEAGVPHAIYIFSWGYGPAGMFLADLLDESGNRKRAAELARMVEDFQKRYPGRPVYLIGHSGGAGMVVFALEAMQPETQVDGVFLLAPALAPDRNLAPALRHVRSACYTTYSAADLPLMGLGTSTFGTMDRKHTPGAGLIGFALPEDIPLDDLKEYRKLRQAGWDAELLAKGCWGGHMAWSTSGFARQYIAPVLLGGRPPMIFKSFLNEADEWQHASVATPIGSGGDQ